MTDIYELTVKKAGELLRSRAISAPELTALYLDRIEKLDGEIGAYITVCPEEAEKAAISAQKKLEAGEAAPLCGIPFAVKDNMCLKGTRTTCASKMLENFIPPYTATAVVKLLDEGAVILGKVNMDEFAMGGSTETSYFKKTRNPHDTARVPGGSSGGSAAAVAAGLALGSLGSDTGGSIRQPAAFCGVAGFKPTYGMVSRYGLVAFASSLDQIGPIAPTIEDCALILDAISGKDPYDQTSAGNPARPLAPFAGADIKGLRVGLPKEYFAEGLSPEIKAAVMRAAELLRENGAQVGETTLPNIKYAVQAYYLIASSEASSNLARYDGIKYGYAAPDCKSYNELVGKTRGGGFGREVKRRILLGTYALASGYYDDYYKKALMLRTAIKRDYESAFEKFDVLLSPTTPTTAYRIGENVDDPLAMYLADIYTVAANIAGLPSASAPFGYDAGGMPIGVCLTAGVNREAEIVRAGAFLEKAGGQSLRPLMGRAEA